MWQTTSALAAIRRGVGEPGDPKLTTVLAVYLSMTELANEARVRTAGPGAESDAFVVGRRRVAEYSGVTDRSVDSAMRTLQRLGLVVIEKRRNEGANHLVSRYVLTDPECEMVAGGGEPSSRGGGETSSPLIKKNSFKKGRGKEKDSTAPRSAADEAWDRFLGGAAA